MLMKPLILAAVLAATSWPWSAVAGASDVLASPPAEAQSDLRSVAFAVEGMSCRRCATSVSEALQRVDGVLRADVSHDERRARVRYDADRVSRERLMEVIRELGYRVEVAESQE